MTGAILAGGKSRRMGFNKAFIEIGGQTLAARSVSLFKKEFDPVYIVANDLLLYEGLGVRLYADLIRNSGSLGGLHTAIFHSRSDYVFVAACDMPFLDSETIKRVVASAGLDAAVPFIGGRYHPLHGVYSKRCLKPIEEMIRDGNLRITDLFERIKVKRLTEDLFTGLPILSSVENVNTKEDLSRITEGK